MVIGCAHNEKKTGLCRYECEHTRNRPKVSDRVLRTTDTLSRRTQEIDLRREAAQTEAEAAPRAVAIARAHAEGGQVEERGRGRVLQEHLDRSKGAAPTSWNIPSHGTGRRGHGRRSD